jgi:hypothetical protein
MDGYMTLLKPYDATFIYRGTESAQRRAFSGGRRSRRASLFYFRTRAADVFSNSVGRNEADG